MRVDFNKWPCRPVEFKGQGPSVSAGSRMSGPQGGPRWGQRGRDPPCHVTSVLRYA